jgi:hypothetical protein
MKPELTILGFGKENTMNFYELVCEDYTQLGGPMGTERTSVIFARFFGTEKRAKKIAEEDHERRDNRTVIEWRKDSRGSTYSGDLSSHAYTITKRGIE